jgi:hypothetical protein
MNALSKNLDERLARLKKLLPELKENYHMGRYYALIQDFLSEPEKTLDGG